ncbi:MAG: hypothetical protein R2744_01220 [Bacteroidales bacterium]
MQGKLFGWTEVVWLRRSMVVFSLVITIMFVMQQFTVYERISSIEDRIISITPRICWTFRRRQFMQAMQYIN